MIYQRSTRVFLLVLLGILYGFLLGFLVNSHPVRAQFTDFSGNSLGPVSGPQFQQNLNTYEFQDRQTFQSEGIKEGVTRGGMKSPC